MELRPGYKHTEAGVIPEDWDAVPLGNYVRITSGDSPSLIRFTSGGKPYFKVEQLSNGDKYLGVFSTPYHFVDGKTVSRNSVIFAKRGAAIALNKIRILREDSFMDTNLMALTPKDGIDFEYLYYGLGYIGLWRFADTTSVPQINNKHINPLPFPLPKETEQRKIASALNDVDVLLATLDQVIAKKRDLKQAAMQQLLLGDIKLAGFNEKWLELSLGEIVKPQKGQLITTKTLTPGDIPVIAGGMQPAYFHASANRYGKTITVSASGASAGYVAFHAAPIFASDCSTISESDQYCIEFIYYALQLRQEEIYAAQTGGAQPHIQPKDLAPILIKIPEDVTEQAAIASVLSDMDAEIAELEERRNKTSEIKQAMMQELLTGKTRLVEPRGANV